MDAKRIRAVHGLPRLGAGAGIDARKAVHRHLDVAAAARIEQRSARGAAGAPVLRDPVVLRRRQTEVAIELRVRHGAQHVLVKKLFVVELLALLLVLTHQRSSCCRAGFQSRQVRLRFGQLRPQRLISRVTVCGFIAQRRLFRCFDGHFGLGDLLLDFLHRPVGWLEFRKQLRALQFQFQQSGLHAFHELRIVGGTNLRRLALRERAQLCLQLEDPLAVARGAADEIGFRHALSDSNAGNLAYLIAQFARADVQPQTGACRIALPGLS